MHPLEFAALPPLNDQDLMQLGRYVYFFSFIEMNLRNCVERLALAGLIEQTRPNEYLKLRAAQLVPVLRVAIGKMAPEVEQVAETLAKLDEIELLRAYRNMIAHWAVKRFDRHNAYVFCTKSSGDVRQAFSGVDLEPGVLATGIMSIADVQNLGVR
jgi:hypothetical protein